MALPGRLPWVAAITDEQLRDALGAAAVQRGAALARAGRVTGVTLEDDGHQLRAGVRGTARHVFTTVVWDPGDGPVEGQCSCRVQVDCEHVAALVLSVRGARGRRTAEPPSSDPRPAPVVRPAWERVLDAVVAPDAAPVRGEPLGLRLETDGARVLLQPVTVHGSPATWREVESPYGRLQADPRHRTALTALWSAWRVQQGSSFGDAAVHLDEVGPTVWRLLAEAERAGVVLLDGAGAPTVTLAPAPADVVADLRRDGGDLVLRARLLVAGSPVDGAWRLVGRPAHGVVASGGSLLLAGFGQPLEPAVAELVDAGEVRVPAADVPRFFTGYYPELQRRVAVFSGDGSVVLPEVVPPRLRLDVRFADDHVTSLVWSFSYVLGEEAVQVPLAGPTEVARDAAEELRLLDALVDLPDVDGVWGPRHHPLPTARLTGITTARFVSALLPRLLEHPGLDLHVEGTPLPYAELAETPLISVSTRDLDTSRDWFGLAVTVSVGGLDVPLGQLLKALGRGLDHLVLVSGAWFSLDRPELQALRRLMAEAKGLQDATRPGLRISPLQVGLWQELVGLGVVADQSERWARTVRGLLDVTELPRPALPAALRADLRPYQLDGYRWLAVLWDLGLGGVLADDMGLGKTLQALAAVARAHEDGRVGGAAGPVLVVAPTSVVATWAAEAARFVPGLPVVTITGTERRTGVTLAELADGAAVVVTSYALLRLDEAAYLAGRWSGLVLDEAQQVKNPASRTYAVCKRLATPFTLAITGTPLENSLTDLWALLSLTAPGLFPDPEDFADTWRRPIETGHHPELLAALRRRTRPLVLRRTKEQVAPELPPKVEQVLEVPLHPEHREVYDRHLQRERQRVLGLLDDLPRNRLAVLRSLTLLRQLSLDASLVDEQHADLPSSKVDVLAGLLREVADEGHRALVFSSFTGFLARVRQRLDADGLGYCYLDGRTRDRARRVQEFRTGTDPAFLISLKAGGTGLTLTEADYVFVLDPWWNPAVEAQAVDRAHRIGQTSTVMVYRLVSTDTVEQKVVALQQKKRELFASVVDGDGAPPAALTAQDLRTLLE